MEHTKGELPKRPWTFLSFDLPTAIYIGTEQKSVRIPNWLPEFNPCLDFILKCVNSHDDLYNACDAVQIELDLLLGLAKKDPQTPPTIIPTIEKRIKQIKDAIAKAQLAPD